MKKLLSLTMAMMMLFSTTAFAKTIDGVDVGDSTIYEQDKTDKKYDVTYTGAVNGKEYMLWALKDIKTEVSSNLFAQENVMYINQATAANNQAVFNDFLPMNNESCTLVISGQGMDAKIIGYLAAGRVLGDLNKDGKITQADAEILLAHVVKAQLITDETVLENADVTEDTAVDMDDVVALMNKKAE